VNWKETFTHELDKRCVEEGAESDSEQPDKRGKTVATGRSKCRQAEMAFAVDGGHAGDYSDCRRCLFL
jgi:hypothetical protein